MKRTETILRISMRVGASVAFGAIVLAGLALMPSTGRADGHGHDDNDGIDENKALIGLRIAPVHLHMLRRDRKLVGLGSYLVNASGDCNGCHVTSPQTQYLPDGNPYFLGSKGAKKVNPETYLAGGSDFGVFPGGVHIVSRNLTPDYSGKPAGGLSWPEFRAVMRTGVDLDHLHPNLEPPFDPNLLQVMPWPAFQDMTDLDLRAIYEYLSAIPCIDTQIEGQPQLRHNCGR